MKKLVLSGLMTLAFFATLGCEVQDQENTARDPNTVWSGKIGTRYYLKSYQFKGENETQVPDPSKTWIKIQGEYFIRGMFSCNYFDAEVLMRPNGVLIFKSVNPDNWEKCEKDNISFKFFDNDAFMASFVGNQFYLEDNLVKLTFSTSLDN